MRTDEIVVLLASKLSPSEQDQLAQLGELLGGRMADTFSGSGSVFVFNWCRNDSLVGVKDPK